MGRFEFKLKLQDGRVVAETVPGEAWQWAQAFGQACTSAESRYGLPPLSGILCVDYSHFIPEPATA